MAGKTKATPLWSVGRAREAGQKRQKKGILGEALFFTSFFAFCMKFTQDYSAIFPRHELVNDLLVGLSILCSMAKIFTQRYTLPRFAATMAVCAVVGYSSLISINYAFLLGFLLVMGMQDVELVKIVKAGFFTKSAVMAVHLAWYAYVYLTDPSAITFMFRAGVGVPRHSFFMGHPNMFTIFLFWACAEYIYLRYEKITAAGIAVIWLINIFFYRFTFSNTGMLVLAVVTALIAADKLGKGFFDKPLAFMAKYLYLFCAAFFPFLAVIYPRLEGRPREMWEAFDNFLTGRLWLGAYAYYAEGLTMLGIPNRRPQVVFWQGRWNNTFTVFDNHYIGNFVSYGVINSALAAIVFIALCGKMENREKIIIIAFAFFAVMQSDVTNVVVCSALFITGKYLYPPKTTQE